VKVVDLNSRNGTFIDETRIESAELRPSQRLRLGEVSFMLLEVSRPSSNALHYCICSATPNPLRSGVYRKTVGSSR